MALRDVIDVSGQDVSMFAEGFILYKDIDQETGEYNWYYLRTTGVSKEELLGALQVQMDLLRHELVSEWEID